MHRLGKSLAWSSFFLFKVFFPLTLGASLLEMEGCRLWRSFKKIPFFSTLFLPLSVWQAFFIVLSDSCFNNHLLSFSFSTISSECLRLLRILSLEHTWESEKTHYSQFFRKVNQLMFCYKTNQNSSVQLPFQNHFFLQSLWKATVTTLEFICINLIWLSVCLFKIIF